MILYRGIRVNDLNAIETATIGVCWTPDLIKARYYATDLKFAHEGAFKVLIETEVSEDDVDFATTGYFYQSSNKEIRLKRDRKLQCNFFLISNNRLSGLNQFQKAECITNQLHERYLNRIVTSLSQEALEETGLQIWNNLKNYYLYPE